MTLHNSHVKDKVLIVKAKWAAHICSKIRDMVMNPHIAWEQICVLTGGTTVHIRKKSPWQWSCRTGNYHQQQRKYVCVWPTFFDRVYNNHQPADLSILKKVPQCPTLLDIDSPITFEEVNAAINKLKNGNIPGLNGIPPEAYKAMNVEMLLHVHRYVSDFFEGKEDYEEWHQSQCVPVPKSGNLSDPNKRRGVMLMDVCHWLWMGELSDYLNSMATSSNLAILLHLVVKTANSCWKPCWMPTRTTTFHCLWPSLILYRSTTPPIMIFSSRFLKGMVPPPSLLPQSELCTQIWNWCWKLMRKYGKYCKVMEWDKAIIWHRYLFCSCCWQLLRPSNWNGNEQESMYSP